MDNRHRQSLSKAYMFRSPMGKIYYIRLLKEFCKDNNLSIKQMRRLAKCKIDEYKSWTLIKVSEKYKRI